MRHARAVAAVLFLAAAATLGAAAPAETEPVILSRLTACDADRSVLFTAWDPAAPGPDTLRARPGAGALAWLGGPVRGLALGADDTLYAATLLGVSVLNDGRPVAFLPWDVLSGQGPGLDPGLWPPLRGAALPAGIRPAIATGKALMLPERYHPLAAGHLLFLTDAEQPPEPGLLLHDLHARDPEGREFLLARNLEVRTWVVASDSLHWALTARLHRPDYGGHVVEALLTGVGTRVETFDPGPVAALAWDARFRLWALVADGRLLGIHPAEAAWRVQTVNPALERCPCTAGPPESLWVWAAPGRYEDRDAARQHGETVQRRLGGGTTWVRRLDDGGFRPVWGGFLSERTLKQKMPDPPVPGARVETVRVDSGEVAGTAARLRMPNLNGIATLRHVIRDERIASELWWRFTSSPREVRLAGPWGFEGPSRGAVNGPLVDSPQREP